MNISIQTPALGRYLCLSLWISTTFLAVLPAREPELPNAQGNVQSVRFGSKNFVIGERIAGTDLKLSTGTKPRFLHRVIQSGRAFELQHRDVRIIANQGRYLLVDMDPVKAAEIGDSEDYSIRPVEPGMTVLDQPEMAAIRQPRVDWVSALVASLSEQRFEEDLIWLADYHTRLSSSRDYRKASKWARLQFKAMGHKTEFQEFALPSGERCRNVIAKKEGMSANPDLILVVGHLDSINEADCDPGARAPGADDNASGSAAVLEIARVLRRHNSEHDVHFILFGGEEQGLRGSSYYVDELCAQEKERIKAVINMDMIGSSNLTPPVILIEGSDAEPEFKELVDQLAESAATYSDPVLNVNVLKSFDYADSDHEPFLDNGIPAALTIEGGDTCNLHIHTINDTTDKIFVDFAMEVMKANLAFVAQKIGQAK